MIEPGIIPLRANGFTLIEVLIALAIIAGMTAVMAEIAQTDARTRGALRERREALMLAQSALDTTYETNAADTGSWGKYSWRIARLGEGQPDPLDQHPLERVSVDVAYEGHTILSLATLRTRT